MKTIQEILSKCDHTLLSQGATWAHVRALCDEGIRYKTASVCIPPSFVKQAKEYVGDRLKLCTVIGFPNGYNTLAVKVFETEDAVKNGADEIDMVLAIGKLKAGLAGEVEEEIRAVKKACGGKILKVIIETCLLTEEEKRLACTLVTNAGADYIKTSTGFSTSGATVEDVRLLKANVGEKVLVKAAGGISGVEDAEKMLAAGASRLGTSRVVKVVQKIENQDY